MSRQKSGMESDTDAKKTPGNREILVLDNVWGEEESVILIHSGLRLIYGNGIAMVTKICGLAIYRSRYSTEIEKTIPSN